jgi:hypothetical protein
MEKIICIRCGAEKDMLMVECDVCQFDPSGDEASEVKTLYLSTLRFEGECDKQRYAIELDDVAKRIKRGETIDYDAAELDRLGELRRAFLAVTPTVLVLTLLWNFAPVIALLAAMALLAAILQYFHGKFVSGP